MYLIAQNPDSMQLDIVIPEVATYSHKVNYTDGWRFQHYYVAKSQMHKKFQFFTCHKPLYSNYNSLHTQKKNQTN